MRAIGYNWIHQGLVSNHAGIRRPHQPPAGAGADPPRAPNTLE